MTDPTAPETPAEQTDHQPSQEARLAARRKKRILIAAGITAGIVALAALGTVGLTRAHETANPPEAEVVEYLDALVEGRASDALALAGVDSDVDIFDAEPALLRDEVFGAAKHRITSYEIVDVMIEEDKHATVTAEIDQGGSKSTMQFQVSSIGEAPFSDRWTLDAQEQAFVYVHVSPSIDQVRVNGVDSTLDLEKEKTGFVLPALPGSYEFSVPESTTWLAAPPVSVTVEAGDSEVFSASIELINAPTLALTDEIDRQIDAYLAECIASTSIRPDNYPNTIDERNSDLTAVSWQLETPPSYSIEVGPDDTVRVWGTNSGIATAAPPGAARNPGDDPSSSIHINGRVEIDDDTVTFVPGKPF